MYSISQSDFEKLVGEAIDAIPPKFGENLQNVAFIVEDEPSPEQRVKLKLSPYQSLYGLYEGVPLVKRNGNSNFLLPDKITIFKLPMEHASDSVEELSAIIHKTVWHEVAHYYGLDHDKINELESKKPQNSH